MWRGDAGKKREEGKEKRTRSEQSVDISTIGNDTATHEDSRRKVGLTPSNPSTGRLISAAAHGYGVSNGVHDVVASAVGA